MERKLGLYIHIPFCIKKCAYCDFLSFPGNEEMVCRYVDSLKKEIALWGQVCRNTGENRGVDTIYIGGGTPSSINENYIKEIINEIHQCFAVNNHAELTIECNPGTVTGEKLSVYMAAGINRISMGLQSAQNEELKNIGRIHTYEEFLHSYTMAREAGFQNINIDIMSALPKQTFESYRRTLERVIALKPEHISSYSLIIEEGTPFYDQYQKGKLSLPDEETERAMYYETNCLLKQHGYCRYEISNYAREGFASRHNSSYWKGEDYLGFGLGASSLYKNIRFRNVTDMERYIRLFQNCGENRKNDILERELIENYYTEVDILSKKEQMEEFCFLGFRMREGISSKVFEERFGENFEQIYGEVCDRLEKEGMLINLGDRKILSDRGIDFSNRVLAEFLL